MEVTNNNVYILSLQGADIYSHVIRGTKIKDEFGGMLPFSLELIKLKTEGFNVNIDKTSQKEMSRDIINVKFKNKVQTGEYIVRNCTNKIEKINAKIALEKDNYKNIKSEEYIVKLQDYINTVNTELIGDNKKVIYKEEIEKKKVKTTKQYTKWDEMSNETVRDYLYENGFKLNTFSNSTNKKKGIVKTTVSKINYVAYGRSSSKSRTGQVNFIRKDIVVNYTKKDLHRTLIDWNRMGLPFVENAKADFAGILAYTTLVGSSIKSTLTLNPKNILLIDDVESVFQHMCNVVKKNEDTGFLDSYEEIHDVVNSLFDGESMLESSFYEEGVSMKLLRNHFFKSASFSTRIQLFLINHCPTGIQYEDWMIPNMFGEMIYAKDILCICTPTSVKCLKFDKDLNMTKQEIWEQWKKVVVEDKCIFGVCKSESVSKRGINDKGDILQQSSYQMINSLPCKDKTDMDILTEFEVNYITKLKNDIEFFLDYAMSEASDINSNEMMVTLARHNKDFMGNKLFRDFKTQTIGAYTKHCQRGKVKLSGDYCIAFGNALEYLYHAIGGLDTKNPQIMGLKDNEIYTNLHDFSTDDNDIELTLFRNPHTSMSNIFVGKNTYIKDIQKYFVLSKNIFVCNAIKCPIQDIASSMDYDSDSMVIFKDAKMLELGKKCYGQYYPCINEVDSKKIPYKICNKDMSLIDNQLATSSRLIGSVVNLGCLLLSVYWDMLSKGSSVEDLSELLKKINIISVLSTITIDLAKKFYDIDIDAEIKNIASCKELKYIQVTEKQLKTKVSVTSKIKCKDYPMFWQYISDSKNIKDHITPYNCPMDYLFNCIEEIPNAKPFDNVKWDDLLIRTSIGKADRGKKLQILDYVSKMKTKINGINASHLGDEDDVIKEKNNLLDNVIKYYTFYIGKLTIKDDLMYSILSKVFKENSDMGKKLLNVLFQTQRVTFLKAFKSNKVKKPTGKIA